MRGEHSKEDIRRKLGDVRPWIGLWVMLAAEATMSGAANALSTL